MKEMLILSAVLCTMIVNRIYDEDPQGEPFRTAEIEQTCSKPFEPVS